MVISTNLKDAESIKNMSFALDKKNVLYLSYSSKEKNELHAVQLDFNTLENLHDDNSEEDQTEHYSPRQ